MYGVAIISNNRAIYTGISWLRIDGLSSLFPCYPFSSYEQARRKAREEVLDCFTWTIYRQDTKPTSSNLDYEESAFEEGK